MKQFRNKQKIKKQLEEENEKIYLGSGNIDEKEALKEMREKTRKFMHIHKEQFKEESKEQKENFEQKIKMSKKIRDFKEETDKEMKMSLIVETNEEHDESRGWSA